MTSGNSYGAALAFFTARSDAMEDPSAYIDRDDEPISLNEIIFPTLDKGGSASNDVIKIQAFVRGCLCRARVSKMVEKLIDIILLRREMSTETKEVDDAPNMTIAFNYNSESTGVLFESIKSFMKSGLIDGNRESSFAAINSHLNELARIINFDGRCSKSKSISMVDTSGSMSMSSTSIELLPLTKKTGRRVSFACMDDEGSYGTPNHTIIMGESSKSFTLDELLPSTKETDRSISFVDIEEEGSNIG